MPKCSFANVELTTFKTVPGNVGDSDADIIVETGKKKARICQTHQEVYRATIADVEHRGFTADEIVLDCSKSQATKKHRVSF